MIKLNYTVERYGPALTALLSVALLLYYRSELMRASAGGSIDLASLYSAVFDWSAIQTGFLFGIFGYVAGKADGFVAAVRGTSAMKLFLSYTRTAIFLGFAITFFSIPLMVTKFSIIEGANVRFYIFLAWASMSVWAFFAFLRVAYVFGMLIRPADQARNIG